MYLLDVNVLIALCDADHVHHGTVRQWFKEFGMQGWATCPLTENGLLRIMGHPAYPGGPGTPAGMLPLLHRLRSHQTHQLFPDSVTLTDAYLVKDLHGIGPKGLTDLYLLALAVHHKAKLVTLDQKIDPIKVTGGLQSYLCLLT